ncbi:MAG: YCF48-related protein [Acidobacteriota bacterium]
MFETKYSIRWVVVILAALLFQSVALAVVPPDGEASGPDKFDDWAVMGPDGGDVRVVAIDPKDANRLYISTLDGQIYTSPDAGKNWSLLVNLNKPQLILDQLFVDSRDSKIIYASGHRHTAPGGFFRTTDGGATWKESKELSTESIHSMTQSTLDPNVITVGTTRGVWISKDSGVKWDRIESGTMPVNVDSLAMDPRTTSTMYAGTWWRAYKTTDSGKNWHLIKDGMIDDSDVFAVTIDPRNADHIVASACSGIYESFNAGEKWAKIQGIPSQSRRTRDIMQHPTMAGTIFAATTEGFWMSSNGGKTWSLTTRRDLEINSIAVHPQQPNRVFIGTNNYGVMVSNDGGRNFVPTNDNFSSRFASSLVTDNKSSDRLYATTQNTATGGGFFFISADSGKTWQPAKNLDSTRIVPFATLQDKTDPNLMYLGTNVGIYRSQDRGVNWTQLTASKPVVKSVRKTVRTTKGKTTAKTTTVKKTAAVTARNPQPDLDPDAVAPGKLLPVISGKVKVLEFTTDGKNGIFAGTDKGLFRSYDLTKGWEKLDLGLGVNDNIFAVHTSAQRPGTIWIGTATSGVLVSKDDGTTWQKAGGAVVNVPVSSIASDPTRPDYIYVGTSQTFYLSRDGGQTWTRKGGNLPLGNFTSIIINPNNPDELLVSSSLESDGGIFQSMDAGNKWKRIDSKEMKLASRRVWTMTMDPNDSNRIFAGTHSSGVYRIERGASAASAAGGRTRVTSDGN